jgi:hypothetical protein
MPIQLPKSVLHALRTLAGLFPLTIQGTITLLVTASALSVFGYGSMDLVVFALSICALAILVFCLFCTVTFGVVMQRRIRKEQELQTTSHTQAGRDINVEAGYPNETGFKLRGTSFLPLVRVDWKVVYPDHIETRTRFDDSGYLVEEIIPSRRCLSEKLVRQFTISDVLGFCRFSWRLEQAGHCMALPKISSVKSLPLLRSLTAEDGIPNYSGQPEGDRMEIRPYAPGDSVKNIMWKVYARTRQLNVRLPEKSVFHSKRTVAYLLGSPNDEAAAAVARVALQSAAFGEDWSFGADGTETPCEDLPTALRAVARSRALDKPYSYGLDRFLERAAGHAMAHCIVFAAAEQAHWLPLLKATINKYRGQITLVLATDGLEEAVTPGLWQRLLLRSETQPAGASQGTGGRSLILDLLTDFGQLVESTLIVDRKTGLSFDQHMRKV